jgi:hypothetical protein
MVENYFLKICNRFEDKEKLMLIMLLMECVHYSSEFTPGKETKWILVMALDGTCSK